jgi:hypothetical protein
VLRCEPVEPAGGLPQSCQRAVRSFELRGHRLQLAGELRALLHRRARLGERGFFAGLGRKGGQLRNGMLQPFAVAIRLFQFGRGLIEPCLGIAPAFIGRRDPFGVELAERIEQGAVAARVEQAAIVMLAMDLDQAGADEAQQPGGRGLIVDVGPAAAIGPDHPANHERFARIGVEPAIGEDGEGRMVAGRIETRGDGRLRGALPHEPGIGARTERQAQRIQQNRFARPGFAGQRAQPGAEFQIERLDQDDVANGQRGQHQGRF